MFFLSSYFFFFHVFYRLRASHEIRTPLNITAVGMDITATELKKLGDKVPAYLLSTVESCQEACASSLEVGAFTVWLCAVCAVLVLYVLEIGC